MQATQLLHEHGNSNLGSPAKEMGIKGKVLPAGPTAKDAEVVQAAETAVEKAVVRKEGKAEDTVPFSKVRATVKRLIFK
jgi:hypothetical protein